MLTLGGDLLNQLYIIPRRKVKITILDVVIVDIKGIKVIAGVGNSRWHVELIVTWTTYSRHNTRQHFKGKQAVISIWRKLLILQPSITY